jgi:hypothetical protein
LAGCACRVSGQLTFCVLFKPKKGIRKKKLAIITYCHCFL